MVFGTFFLFYGLYTFNSYELETNCDSVLIYLLICGFINNYNGVIPKLTTYASILNLFSSIIYQVSYESYVT